MSTACACSQASGSAWKHICNSNPSNAVLNANGSSSAEAGTHCCTDFGVCFVQMAKVGVALTTGRTGAPPVLSDTPMEEDLAPSAMPSTNSAGQVSGAGTRTQTEADAQNWVQPQSFKSLVGRGHPEFASGHQQVGSHL